MFLDEGDDIVHPLFRRLETAGSIGRDDELVATDTPAVSVHADVAGIAQAVAPVQAVARVLQHVLYIYPTQEIIVGKVTFSHCSYRLSSCISCLSAVA